MAEPRPELRDLLPAVHGGDAPDGVLDCSTGVSPLPPPPSLLAAVRAADVTRYPHPTALPLRRALAAAHGVDEEAVVAGAGSVELIWALARAFGGPGRRVAWVAPAFAEYAQAARASGAVAVAVDDAADAQAADLLFVARPGNPTLAVPSLGAVIERGSGARSGLLVVDEAYQPLCEDVAPVTPSQNVAVLRSLTKVFALPGLRLGYLLASPSVARAVRATLPPWNVSQPAIAAGLAALAEPVEPVRAAVGALRQRLVARLERAGARVTAANGSFVVVDVGDGARVAAALLARGVRVRDCASFGLPSLVRVGVRGDEDQERLLQAWEAIG
jgi:histidinol-phosphate/aromatic aminotransferase/cobyric acid decarboxylase-like protein